MTDTPDRAATLRALEKALEEPRCQTGHEWEYGTGGWGVIIGASCCKKCGKLATDDDFPIHTIRSLQKEQQG